MIQKLLFPCALLICSGAACASDVVRPASEAERRAAGFEDAPSQLFMREMPLTSVPRTRHEPLGSSWKLLTRFGVAFNGRNSDFAFGAQTPSIYCPSGTSERFADATLDLPDGSGIQFVDVFGRDVSSTDDLTVFLFSVCQADSPLGAPDTTVLGSTNSTGNAGNFVAVLDLSAAPPVVSAYSCRYFARVSMADPSGGCAGPSIYLDKVRITYSLP